MTIKINAPRSYYYDFASGKNVPYRMIDESDWLKLMKLVRKCEVLTETNSMYRDIAPIDDALAALRSKK
jgi:hypothetical protein